MKATFLEFDDNGKILREFGLSAIICDAERVPNIEIEIPQNKKNRHVTISLPIRALVDCLNRRLESKVKLSALRRHSK